MCNCSLCNITEEDQQYMDEEYIKYRYEQYCTTTKESLSIDDWLQSLPIALG
jgi:hypothetical protein